MRPRTLAVLAVTVLLFWGAFALSAQAHTPDELEVWVVDTVAIPPTPDQLAAYLDMMARHDQGSSRPPLSSSKKGVELRQWRSLVDVYFPTSQVDRALCVIQHESGGDPDIKNPESEARGLFQIMASVWASVYSLTYDDFYDPEINTATAADIWSRHGWWPWAVYQKGHCR